MVSTKRKHKRKDKGLTEKEEQEVIKTMKELEKGGTVFDSPKKRKKKDPYEMEAELVKMRYAVAVGRYNVSKKQNLRDYII